jgi:hypothetical protein
MKIQAALLDLERRVGKLTQSTAPGTQLVRCLAAADAPNLFKDCPKLKMDKGRSVMVWALHLGPMGRRGRIWYGETVPAAIRNARRDVAAVEKNWKVGTSAVCW